MKGVKYIWLLLGVVTTVAGAAYIGASTPAQAASCVDGDSYKDFTGTRSGNTVTVWTKNDAKLCNDTPVNFTTFKVDNPNYNGQSFHNNPTAIPQSYFWNKTVIMKKGTNGKTTVTFNVPDACTPYQIDAYIGDAQTSITTSAGLKGTTAIVGKLFAATQSDCSVPQVEACNTSTGVIGPVDKDKANTAPYTTDLSKCKIDVCNTNTGLYEKVDKNKANTAPYTTDLSKCQVKVCNKDTGVVETINKSDANQSKYTNNMDDCEKVKVCILNTGKTGTVTKEEAKDTSKYGETDNEACNPKEVVEDTEEDEEEVVTPEELPQTGPVEALSGVIGLGSLAGVTTAYVRSRRIK